MVLTYQEAVEAAARALVTAHGGDPDRLCQDDHAQWTHWTNEATAVLEAVGYADLLAEINLDECSICSSADEVRADGTYNAGWAEAMRFAHHAHADETSNGYPSANGVLGSGPDAVIVDGDWLARIVAERDALAATVARVKVEGGRWANSKNYTSQFAGGLLREALRPPADWEVDD